MAKKKTVARVAFAVVGIAVLATAIYIMANGIGLQDDLDFGAGAYYYADIPADQYEEIDPDGAYQSSVPKWIYYVLFLGWGWLMWRLWCRISK